MSNSITVRAAPRRWAARGAAELDRTAVDRLRQSLNLPEPLCRLLVLRGHADDAAARRFLRPRIDQLRDAGSLAGIAGAVERIELAISRRETILVHGDYDVDGICATALYTRVLRMLGGSPVPFVPRRLVDGYDLGEAGVRAAAEAGASLILTGDCGIVAHDAVLAASRAGIDVVVTDHHTPGPALPEAIAVLNPHRSDCGYPEKGLCGTGVAFKLCQALVAARGLPAETLWPYLDLVAMATIADLMPLTGENRVLSRYGLRVLAETTNPGLRALIRVAGLEDPKEISAGQVGHVLAPRLNAVGRMDEAIWGVRLLLSETDAEATAIAQRLEEHNRERQATDRRTLDEALALLERSYDPDRDYGLVLAAEGWHPGVIGIVASRVVEQVNRPTILIAIDGDTGRCRGSGRSIRGFHLYEALRESQHLLERYGGHRAAAGLDILPERIDEFRAAFNAHARRVLTPEDLVGTIDVDLEVRITDLTADFWRYLKHFGPFGMGNPSPVLVLRGARAASCRIVGEQHLKLQIADATGTLPAIGFRMGDRFDDVRSASSIDVAFQLQQNEWNGGVELQAKLLDVRCH